MVTIVGLMLTKEDHEVFGDWCDDQLPLYDHVICLDGSKSDVTRRIAEEFPDKLSYLHERQFSITHFTDHGLRKIVHEEIVRKFGLANWIMCCHPDEFCYHDPRRLAELAQADGHDLVSWLCPHFYPHPSEFPQLDELQKRPVPERYQHFHWGHLDTNLPWIEDRLYRNSEGVRWDGRTHGSVRPLGIERPAPYCPILKHYKVCSIDREAYQPYNGHTLYAHHWSDQGDYRTGLPFRVDRVENLFVDRIPNYQHCDRFNGSFSYGWNIGDELQYERDHNAEEFDDKLQTSQELIERGAFQQAEDILLAIRKGSSRSYTKSTICTNLGVLKVLQGQTDEGRLAFEAAIALNRSNESARLNLREAVADSEWSTAQVATPGSIRGAVTRIAIVSCLFNWPSTGGGTIHTKELAEFLARSGFEVLHVFARYDGWGVGRCEEELSVPAEVLSFDESDWSLENVIERFRSTLKAYGPDYVVVTDSWNSKPWLATAADQFPYVMRYQALENLCPLNNVRLLPSPSAPAGQCGRHQLATPHHCHACCHNNSQFSGPLHRAERQFSRVGTQEYDRVLRRTIESAEAVLVVNPLMQAMFSPWNQRTFVVPSGMDPARFADIGNQEHHKAPRWRKRLLFAGLVAEYMKGFHVLRQACDQLWSRRQDFELIATSDPTERESGYLRFVGWADQQQLVSYLRSSDMLVFPTIAQEALGRTAVEAMACGIPVVASGIGGLNYTVTNGLTGLLTTPGDANDLAAKIEFLLDHPEICKQFGQNGRQRFKEEYAWPVIIDRHYRPLFSPTTASSNDCH